MDVFLNGLTSIVSNVINSIVSGASALFNILVETNAETGAITGVSVAGWFVVLGIGLTIVTTCLAFFKSMISRRR